jgi:hypothetical protein
VSLLGVGRGLFKLTQGIIERDGEKITKGGTGTAISIVGLVITHCFDEATGEQISEKAEEASDS